MNNENKGKQIEAHLRIWLLQGKKITFPEAWRMWRTTRLSEYIRRCRNAGLNIITEMVTQNGDTFAVYYLEKKKKESRITNRDYMRQAYSKKI